jgi:hypothetical protein
MWTKQYHLHCTVASKKFTEESVAFQEKILQRSGLGDQTYLPPGLAAQPPACSMQDARQEFEQVRARVLGAAWCCVAPHTCTRAAGGAGKTHWRHARRSSMRVSASCLWSARVLSLSCAHHTRARACAGVLHVCA